VLAGLPNYPEGGSFRSTGAIPALRCVRRSGGRSRARGDAGQDPPAAGLNYLSAMLSGASLGTWRLRGKRFDAIFVFQPSPITTCLPAILIGRSSALRCCCGCSTCGRRRSPRWRGAVALAAGGDRPDGLIHLPTL